MDFFDEEHKKAIAEIKRLWKNLDELSTLAKSYGIQDILQDNGAKVLQQLIYLNFKNLPGREGNDAVDNNNIEWEMKSINIDTSASGFSTNHHTTFDIIDKFRKVPWSFAIYNDLDLIEIYVMLPSELEPLFSHWEDKLRKKKEQDPQIEPHLNNPKISIAYVKEHGTLVYSEDELLIDPCSITSDFDKF